MKRIALLLTGRSLTPNDQNLRKILDFFGISWIAVSDKEFTTDRSPFVASGAYCVLIPADAMASILESGGTSRAQLQSTLKTAHSAYVYGAEDASRLTQILRFLTGDPDAEANPLEQALGNLTVSKDFPEICGPLAGLSLPASLTDACCTMRVSPRVRGVETLVSADDGAIFLGVSGEHGRFFLSASHEIIDINAPIKRGYFDIQKCFCAAAPLVMFIKWAFRDACWCSRESNACLIVDDPLLQPRYGFFDFRQVLDLMERYGFSTNISFIPWNWRRTNPAVAQLFAKHPDKFSISIHGLDHTAGEFATRSVQDLNYRAKLAAKRMRLHRAITGVPYDPVMVFPQGVFSAEAAHVLKHNNFIAAVNTEVTPLESLDMGTEIAELWDVAIMKYASFPIFTRRYPRHGIVNFAFDLLLGKPCLIVSHHDFFKDSCSEVVNLVERLNSLNCTLKWRGLGETLKHSWREQRDEEGNTLVQMYANALTVENPESQPRAFHLSKKECDGRSVRAVECNGKGVDWSYEEGNVSLSITVPPNERALVQVIYNDVYGESMQTFSARYRIKTCVRRYVSEIRDNHLSQVGVLAKCAAILNRLIR